MGETNRLMSICLGTRSVPKFFAFLYIYPENNDVLGATDMKSPVTATVPRNASVIMWGRNVWLLICMHPSGDLLGVLDLKWRSAARLPLCVWNRFPARLA